MQPLERDGDALDQGDFAAEMPYTGLAGGCRPCDDA